MSINFLGTSDENGSPFLARHERVAAEWTAFAAENGSAANGTFNAYQIEVHLTLADCTGTWSISGHRRQSTIGGGIPMDSPVHEATCFQYDPLMTPGIEFRVHRIGIRSSLLKLLGKPVHPSGISTDLVVHTSDLATFQQVIRGHGQQLAQLGLHHLRLAAPTGLEAKFNRLIGDAATLSNCLNVLHRLTLTGRITAQVKPNR